jgi:hypothetical protein
MIMECSEYILDVNVRMTLQQQRAAEVMEKIQHKNRTTQFTKEIIDTSTKQYNSNFGTVLLKK